MTFPDNMSRYLWGMHTGDAFSWCYVETDGRVVICDKQSGILQRWETLDAARASNHRVDEAVKALDAKAQGRETW